MKFLDSTGLAYLWGKIKTALGGKGDSLDLNGQTLSLKSGENALSSVTLPGGGGSSGGGEVIYSTEERVIGRWIDNRPLYQKTIHQTGFYIQGGSQENIVILPSGCEIKTWSGYIGDGYSKFPLCYNKTEINLGAQMARIDFLYTQCLENILVLASGRETSFSNASVVVTVEYTKTSDQPVS